MKLAKLPIKKVGQGWQFSVPASMSPTGKRFRPKFETKEKAKAERQIFLNQNRKYGSGGNLLTPAESEDARKALDALEGTGLSLSEVVAQHLERTKVRNQSRTVADLLDGDYRISAGIDPKPWSGANKNLKCDAESTLADKRRIYAKFKEAAGQQNASDLTLEIVESHLHELFPTSSKFDQALAYLKGAFNRAVKAGRSNQNPFVGIERTHEGSETEILESAEEVQAVLSACADHRANEKLLEDLRVDCTDALPVMALAIFAGIRPDKKGEMGRLEWSDIKLDNGLIRIPSKTSKTKTLRNVEIAPNLRAFLEPYAEKTGSVLPPNWKRKYQAVRKVSKISDRQADILRHTYASAFLQAGRSMDELLLNIGHTTKQTTLNHYYSAMDRQEAIKFWLIGPKGWKPLEKHSGDKEEGREVAHG